MREAEEEVRVFVPVSELQSKPPEPSALERLLGLQPFTDLRALTLWQPMAGAIAHLGKDFENRPRWPPGTLLERALCIHAGMHYEKKHHAYIVEQGLATADQINEVCRVHGAIIAICRVHSRWSFTDLQDGIIRDRHQNGILREYWTRPPKSRWYMAGTAAGITLDCVVPLDPIPCMGMQGYWRVGENQRAEITRQLTDKLTQSLGLEK